MKKVVLITGTNSGFGYLTAKGAAERGYTVYASMRNTQTRNKARADELGSLENIEVIDIDVTDSESVEKGISHILKKEGRLDVLVNNAGYYGGGITESYSEQDVEAMFNVNLLGTWRTIKNTLPQMRNQGEGLIINISSGLGRFSAPFMTVYNSTKFAVEGLSEGLHYELRPLGVDVAIIQPGAFPTEIFSKTAQGSDAQVVEGYGQLAQVPQQIGEGMSQMFESVKPNPQMVPDAIFELMETPKGHRPLRTVVDPLTGQFVEQANDNVKKDFDNFLTAFGMEAMLN